MPEDYAYKILIVDDNISACNLVKSRLEASGYAVVVAHNGNDGFNMAVNEQPDLILLDVMMPGIDGFTVLRRLRSASGTSGIPVVMLTAKGETDSLMNAVTFRANDYIIKPFKFDDLLKVIQKYTEE